MRFTVLLLLGLVHNTLYAQEQKSPLSGSLYYEMGGGQSFSRPLNEDNTTGVEIGVGADLRLPLSCDIWDGKHLDPEVWSEIILDYAEGQINQLGMAIVAQLGELGTGIAVAALQRALPGIYDYSQNLQAQLTAKIDIAKRSCEQVVSDINQGINPLDPWKRIGVAVGWRTTLTDTYSEENQTDNGAAPSILSAQRDIAERGTTAPIPWFGGEAGSEDRPIQVVADLVTAGYNLEQGSNDLAANSNAAGSTATVPTTILGDQEIETRLATLWPSSEAAVEWATRFLGEQTVYTCETLACNSSMDAGVGLSLLAQEEATALVTAWQDLISTDAIPTVANMREVSSQEVMITPKVYQALMRFETQDQDVYIGRLISDVALARTVERAMAIRKLISTSSRSPIVQGYVQAAEVANELTDRIREEVEDLLWSVRIEQGLASTAAGAILRYDARRTLVGAQQIGNMPFDTGQNTFYDRPVSD